MKRNRILLFWYNVYKLAQLEAEELHVTTGFTYRVRWLFNGMNVECYSQLTDKWYTVKVINSCGKDQDHNG